MRSLSVIVASLAILAASTALAALPFRPSKLKGRVRLTGSLAIGLALVVAFPEELHEMPHSWWPIVIPLGGLFLIWLGIRKYQRDPEGRTPPAQIL